MASPYAGQQVAQWADTTRALIEAHPLSLEVIHDSAMLAWERLWKTWIGDVDVGFSIAEINPPATVIGYMFEKLFAKELAGNLPGEWRGGTGSEKDLHCLSDEKKSVEMKTSGQLGYKIYGNRSYAQELENADAGKKDKSGYYITVNFNGQKLTCLRFGWIDSSDWKPQKSPTGQMAGLGAEVYAHKLCRIPGQYMLNGPLQLLGGVGKVTAEKLASLGLNTIGQLIQAQHLHQKYKKLQAAARQQYQGLY